MVSSHVKKQKMGKVMVSSAITKPQARFLGPRLTENGKAAGRLETPCESILNGGFPEMGMPPIGLFHG